MTYKTDTITSWKQILRKSVDTVSLNCMIRKKFNDKNTIIFKKKLKNIPKCLYSISRPICRCQIKCLEEIKQIIKPSLKNCKFFDISNVFSDKNVDCKKVSSHFRIRHMTNKLDFRRYVIYKNELIYTKGYKYVIEAFCDGRMKKTDFVCYMFSLREFCTARYDCYKVANFFLNSECPPLKFAKGIIIIENIFGKSVFYKKIRNVRSINYIYKNFTNNTTIRNQTNFFTSIYYDKNKILNDKEKKFKQILNILIQKNNHNNTKTINLLVEDSEESFAKSFKNYVKQLNSSEFLKDEVLSVYNTTEKSDKNDLQNEILGRAMKKNTDIIFHNSNLSRSSYNKNYKNFGLNALFNRNDVLPYEICGGVLFSTIIFSIILYKSNIRNSILGILLLVLLLLNVFTLGIVIFDN